MRRDRIYERGACQFQVKIRRNGVNETRTFETRAAAANWRDTLIGRIASDDYVNKKKEKQTPLKDILERYKNDITPHKRGARTEKSRIELLLRENFAEWSIASVDSLAIAQYRDRLAKEGKAASTISNNINTLSAVFKLARTEWGYRVGNPCEQLHRPAASEGRIVVLSAEHEARLLAECKKESELLETIVRIAIASAMRQGEILGLTWSNIHEEYLHLPLTKNGTARDVPLNMPIKGLGILAEIMNKIPKRNDPDGRVFHISTDALVKAYRSAEAECRRQAKEDGLKLPHLTFHDLRHAATTRLSKYVDVATLAKITGHKTLKVLMRYYNPTGEDLAEKVAIGVQARARQRL